MRRPPRLTRRELVFAAGAASAAALAPPAFGRLLDPAPAIGPGRFLDGVASGEPAPDAVTFWSRLTTDRPASGARLVVADDPELRRTVATTVVPTSRAVDGTLKVRIDGLQPGRHYWYAFESGDEASPIGRTKTAPALDSGDAVVVGFSSCQRYEAGFYNAHLDAAADELDLYVQLGDYVYEYDEPEPGTPGRAEAAAVDLTSYRAKYALYRSDAALRELHRLHPVVSIWDDHEVADNYTDGNPAPSALQRAAGYRASFEWLPRIALPDDRYRIYRSLRLGRTAEVLLCDQRQYRGDGTLLGRPQLDWLKSSLADSPARWKLVGNQLVISPLAVAGVIPVNADQWDGYPAERAELLDHLLDGAVDDVVFLTGDIHIYMANQVNRGLRRVATEYVGGSVTSSGIPAPLDLVAAPVIQLNNPHIRYLRGSEHGWARLRADAGELRVDYRVSDITRQGAPSTTLASFRQPAGENGFERVGGPLDVAPKGILGADDPADRPAPLGSALARRRSRAARAATRDLDRRLR